MMKVVWMPDTDEFTEHGANAVELLKVLKSVNVILVDDISYRLEQTELVVKPEGSYLRIVLDEME